MAAMDSTFSQRQEEMAGDYRRISGLAMATLLFGLLSVVALAHPAAWVVPLIGLVLGLFSLFTITRSESVSGSFAAWVGISLALFFLAWASSSYYFQRRVVYQEAQAVAAKWFDMVLAGEAEMAHQAMLHPARRQAVGLSVDDYYTKDEKAREDLELLFAGEPAKTLLNYGTDATVKLVENVTQDVDVATAKLVRQVYRITKPGQDPIDAMLSITRQIRDDLGRVSWIVASIEEPEVIY